LIPSDEENIEWIKSFAAGEKWLQKLSVRKSGSEATMAYYCRSLREFSEFIKKDPDEIITEYKADIKDDLEEAMEKWSDLLDNYAAHLMKRMKKSSAAVFHAAIKSFFKYNSKVELQAPTPEFYSERVPPVTSDELKELDRLADVQQRFCLRFLKDNGISRSDVVRLNYGDIRKELEKGEQVIHIEMLRGKENVEYDTFIGQNAIEALKAYLTLRRTRGEEITDETPIFSSESVPYHRLSPAGLSAVFKRLSEKAGIKVTPHKLRKFFETYLALAKVHPVILKYWMGHKVKTGKKDVEMRYIIPPVEEQRQLYAEAYPKIDVTGVSLEERLRKVEKLREVLGPEKIKMMEEVGIYIRKTKKQPERKIRGVSKVKRKETVPNGGNCNSHAIITEEQLLPYLDDGWEIVRELSNGKIVVVKQAS